MAFVTSNLKGHLHLAWQSGLSTNKCKAPSLPVTQGLAGGSLLGGAWSCMWERPEHRGRLSLRCCGVVLLGTCQGTRSGRDGDGASGAQDLEQRGVWGGLSITVESCLCTERVWAVLYLRCSYRSAGVCARVCLYARVCAREHPSEGGIGRRAEPWCCSKSMHRLASLPISPRLTAATGSAVSSVLQREGC